MSCEMRRLLRGVRGVFVEGVWRTRRTGGCWCLSLAAFWGWCVKSVYVHHDELHTITPSATSNSLLGYLKPLSHHPPMPAHASVMQMLHLTSSPNDAKLPFLCHASIKIRLIVNPYRKLNTPITA